MRKHLRQKIALIENLTISGFALFALAGVLQHEMWRDELQSWMLARDSTSIANLFQNMAYEGHPALWHLCLYGLSQITSDPLIMQLFNLLISIGTICLIVKASPFPLIQRVLLSFGYFTFFEYTFISRNYSIGVLLSVLFCVIYAHLGRRYLALCVVIFLLANTNAYSLIVSLALALFLVLEARAQPSDRWRMPSQLVSGLIIAGFGWLLSGLQITRAAIPQIMEGLGLTALVRGSEQIVITSGMLSAGPVLPEQVNRFVYAVAEIWRSYVPIPAVFRPWFWNSNILDLLSERFQLVTVYGVPIGISIAFVLSLFLIAAVAYFFSPDRTVLSTYLFGTSALILFRTVVHDSVFARHRGHFFILFVLCFWLLEVRASRRSSVSEKPVVFGQGQLRLRFLSVILCLQAIAGIYTASVDYLRPFSAGEDTARFIQQSGLAEVPIFGSPYREASVISGYLDVPIYYPEKQATGSFWTYRLPDIESETKLVQRVEERLDEVDGARLLLVLTEPLSAAPSASLEVQELAHFKDSINLEENFYLYLAERR